MKVKESRIPPEAERFMARALKLARRGLGRTDPNPMVGAVIVKSGKVVGEGYHHAAGRPHAEIEAIREASRHTQGAQLFVTLEPCNHQGLTPPCTHAILKAGLRKVWFGMKDPNPNVQGGGADFLADKGIEVIGPVLEDRCRTLNEVYLTNVLECRPFVYLKLAMSLDGKIATRTGESRWITSEASRRKVHQLRNRVSAIMVGIGTVLADDPSLTTRLPGKRTRDPIRVVVDSTLRIPLNAKVLDPESPAETIIGCGKSPRSARVAGLRKKGARIIQTTGTDQVNLRELMSQLYDLGITSVLIEGGATLAWSALQERIVDRCLFFYAPTIIGGAEAPTGVGGRGIDKLHRAMRLTNSQISRVGGDILVSGRVVYSSTDAHQGVGGPPQHES